MSSGYYKPCRELDLCNELIEKYFNARQYAKCFEGHLSMAEQRYPLASPVLRREAGKVLKSIG